MLLIQHDLLNGGGDIKQTGIVCVLVTVMAYPAHRLLGDWLVIKTLGTCAIRWAMGHRKVYQQVLVSQSNPQSFRSNSSQHSLYLAY